MHKERVLSFKDAEGIVAYNMTNNYMFRYILQENKKVLKGLICALLHLKPEQIKSIEIKNPINLAGDVAGKEFILDINVMMNDDTLINLEMQVANEHNWPERSLIYLCRAFDQLYHGQEYEEVLPAIHIGFLDYSVFPKEPNETELATDEDRAYGIDYWARVFKAKTWEELKMLAERDEYLEETVESLYKANADEIVRQQCRAREDAERRERTLERDNRKLKQENEILEKETEALREEKETLKEEKKTLKEEKETLREEKEALEEENAYWKKRVEELEKQIKNQ